METTGLHYINGLYNKGSSIWGLYWGVRVLAETSYGDRQKGPQAEF